MYLKKRFQRFMRPAGEGGEGGGGGATDRGDDFNPTGVDAVDADDPKKVEPSAEDLAAAATLEAEEKAAKEAKEKKSALKADPEEVDESTLTDEEKAAAAEKAKAKAKDTRIPAARHKEILDAERGRREAVEKELAKYKQGTQIADTNAEITEAETKLLKLEKEYAELLTDGKTTDAVVKMAELRRLERSIITKSSEMREQATYARAVETARYDVTVERLEVQFPQLNIDHDDFDKAKTSEVLEMKEAFQLKGYTPSEALQKAVRYVMPPVTKKQEAALETEARVDPAAIEAARKKAAADKTAAAVEATPSSATKVGKEHDAAGGGAVTAKDIMKMPYADFIKLDENALARARGDVV